MVQQVVNHNLLIFKRIKLGMHQRLTIGSPSSSVLNLTPPSQE